MTSRAQDNQAPRQAGTRQAGTRQARIPAAGLRRARGRDAREGAKPGTTGLVKQFTGSGNSFYPAAARANHPDTETRRQFPGHGRVIPGG